MLPIDLRGKRAFIAGVGDDKGFGWAIAKALADAGCEILVGTWTPMLRIFTTSFENGKFDESRKLRDGSLLQFTKVYPLDATFDTLADVPEDIRENKRYKDVGGYTISEVAESIRKDFGTIDIFIHSLANGPEVQKPLLETSRKGYLAAISSSSYSYVSLLQHLGPLMNKGGAALSLTYLASEKVIPGYGGGMSSAKAALESDTRVLAFEMAKRYGVRVNVISAGPFGSRAAKAIGFIEKMIEYTAKNSPLGRQIEAEEVAHTAAFLTSPLASGITGTVLHVDSGMSIMGASLDSPTLA
ncbi:MAG: fabI [Chlamydiia bacterium]|nr:fabI [Chlamydiia bacterium]